MSRTILSTVGLAALLLAGCKPAVQIDVNANANLNGSVEQNANTNQAAIGANEDAAIQAELNAVTDPDVETEMKSIEAEINAQ